MALPILVDDLYYKILEELDSSSDVSAFMMSSWHLYSLGVDRLLQLGVIIRTDDHLVSFCRFMTRNFLDVHRTTYQLRRLTIQIGESADKRYISDSDSDSELPDFGSSVRFEWFEPSQGASLLVSVLQCISNLEVLSLVTCEHPLRSDGQLVEAFAALTSLQELRLRGFGLLSYDFAASLRSTLRCFSADLRFTVDGRYINSDEGGDLVDPLSLLRAHQTTLEEVVIHHGDLTPWIQDREPRTADCTFPTVQTLVLTFCRITQRDVLVHAFPSVAILQVFMMVPLTPDSDDDDHTPDERHITNSNNPQQWDDLDHVVGDVDSLYMLALESPQPITSLEAICWAFDEDAVSSLHVVIEKLQPQRLLLAWGYWSAFKSATEVSPQQLSELFVGLEEGCSQDIIHLELDTRLSSFTLGPPADYMPAITNLVASLPNVHAFSFRLDLSTRSYHKQDEEGDPPAILVAAYTNTFEDDGLARWATQLAHCVQSLETIRLSVMGRCMAWTVAREAGGGLQRLYEPAAEDADDGNGERSIALAEGMIRVR